LITFTKMHTKLSSVNYFLVYTALILFSVSIEAIGQQGSKKTIPLPPKDTVAPNAIWIPRYDLEQELIPLDEIMVLAIEHSPYIKYDAAQIMISRTSLTLTRRDWLQTISATGMYSAGNQQIAYGNLNNAQSGSQTSILNGYRYGVNVNIPLTEFGSRNARIKQGKAGLEAAQLRKEQTEFSLRRQVIQEFNNLVGAQKLLKIKTEGRENARLTYQMAEKQFREGGIQLSEMNHANDALVNAESSLQMAITEYKILFLSFEELIGVKLNTLKRTK
jgi:outer membrane protein TolC